MRSTLSMNPAVSPAMEMVLIKPKRSRAKAPAKAAAETVPVEASAVSEAAVVAQTAPAKAETVVAEVAVAEAPALQPAPEPVVEDGPPKPKKKGWWSLGR